MKLDRTDYTDQVGNNQQETGQTENAFDSTYQTLALARPEIPQYPGYQPSRNRDLERLQRQFPYLEISPPFRDITSYRANQNEIIEIDLQHDTKMFRFIVSAPTATRWVLSDKSIATTGTPNSDSLNLYGPYDSGWIFRSGTNKLYFGHQGAAGFYISLWEHKQL